MVLTMAQYIMLQQSESFMGIIVNASNTTANDGGYTVRLSASEWKTFQINNVSTAAKAASTSTKATKLKVTVDASGLNVIMFVIICL